MDSCRGQAPTRSARRANSFTGFHRFVEHENRQQEDDRRRHVLHDADGRKAAEASPHWHRIIIGTAVAIPAAARSQVSVVVPWWKCPTPLPPATGCRAGRDREHRHFQEEALIVTRPAMSCAGRHIGPTEGSASARSTQPPASQVRMPTATKASTIAPICTGASRSFKEWRPAGC